MGGTRAAQWARMPDASPSIDVLELLQSQHLEVDLAAPLPAV